MKLFDGTGRGFKARVNRLFQLVVYAVIETADRLEARDGKTWTVTSSTTPVGTNDYIFYFKNTSSDTTYTITDVRAVAAAATLLSIDAVQGTPTFAAGVDLTPVNRHQGKSVPISGTIKEDTNTTGLTDNGRIFPIQVEAANKMAHLRTSSNIIIPPGQAIAMESSVSTLVTCSFSFSVLDDLV